MSTVLYFAVFFMAIIMVGYRILPMFSFKSVIQTIVSLYDSYIRACNFNAQI